MIVKLKKQSCEDLINLIRTHPKGFRGKEVFKLSSALKALGEGLAFKENESGEIKFGNDLYKFVLSILDDSIFDGNMVEAVCEIYDAFFQFKKEEIKK